MDIRLDSCVHVVAVRIVTKYKLITQQVLGRVADPHNRLSKAGPVTYGSRRDIYLAHSHVRYDGRGLPTITLGETLQAEGREKWERGRKDRGQNQENK